jgi:hypothetical protein
MTSEWHEYQGELPAAVAGLGATPVHHDDAWWVRQPDRVLVYRTGVGKALRWPGVGAHSPYATPDQQKWALAGGRDAYALEHDVGAVGAHDPYATPDQQKWALAAARWNRGSQSNHDFGAHDPRATPDQQKWALAAHNPRATPHDQKWALAGRGVGDANQDGLDITMQDRASTLVADYNGGSLTAAANGDVTNFQLAWNNSTPGQAATLAVDGKYGPKTAQAEAAALAWTGPNGNVVGGTAPPAFDYGGGGGGGPSPGPSPSPSPTPPSPGPVTPTAPSSGDYTTPILIGAAVLATAIVGVALYKQRTKGRAHKHAHA